MAVNGRGTSCNVIGGVLGYKINCGLGNTGCSPPPPPPPPLTTTTTTTGTTTPTTTPTTAPRIPLDGFTLDLNTHDMTIVFGQQLPRATLQDFDIAQLTLALGSARLSLHAPLVQPPSVNASHFSLVLPPHSVLELKSNWA